MTSGCRWPPAQPNITRSGELLWHMTALPSGPCAHARESGVHKALTTWPAMLREDNLAGLQAVAAQDGLRAPSAQVSVEWCRFFTSLWGHLDKESKLACPGARRGCRRGRGLRVDSSDRRTHVPSEQP